MKKLLIVITALLVSTGAIAQHGHYGHGGHRGHGDRDLAGLVIGSIVLGTIISNSQRQVIVQQPPVIVHQPPVFNFPNLNYYSCLVQVQDPYTGVIRNEVRTCVNQ
jgi:hypothetical protein